VGANFGKTTSHYFKKSTHFKTGYALALSLGYRASYNMWWCSYVTPRFEFEYSYRRNDVNYNFNSSFFDWHWTKKWKGYATSSLGFFNTCFEFNTSWRFTPYVGLGVGYGFVYSRLVHKDETLKEWDRGFGGQLILGAFMPVFNKTEMGVDYRCLIFRENINEHTVTLSLRRFF